MSGYVFSRQELQLRSHVNLKTGKITPTTNSYLDGYDRATATLDKYHCFFDSALCLWYKRDRINRLQSMMRFHSDHSAYQRGAIMLNLVGRINFQLKPDWKNIQTHAVNPGDVVEFDNKVPHAVDWHPDFDGYERMCVILFKLKPQPNHKQLTLF